MVRGRGGKGGARGPVRQRPAVRRVVVAVGGRSRAGSTPPLAAGASGKPELAATALPLEARLAAVPCRGGEAFLRALFEPLGYRWRRRAIELDESMPALGPSRLLHGHASGNAPLERAADAPVRAHSGARQSEALLGGRRRSREAAAPRRGLARQPSGARADRLALSRAPARASFATPSRG